ncbi:MAG TPA: EAL domain-containing protein [Micropepsaceae bacterium]|nr:EAL domain-containing protein [Micropepsaceae bacterium]
MTDIFTNNASVAVNAAFAWLVHQSFRLDYISTGLAAALFVIAALQIRSALSRARRMHEMEEDMEDLRTANANVQTALDDTKRKVAEVTLAIAEKTEAREKKITEELRVIEGLVREFSTNMAARLKAPAPVNVPGPRVIDAHPAKADTDPQMLEIIRRSLEENRVDLYLQPVVSLPQRKVRFYEALSRLRSEDGAIIMPAQYIRIAAPAGLMSVIDNLLLFRCVQIVRRLTQKQRDLAVFFNISAQTLSDPEFFPQFLDFMHHHRDLASQIIFEFPQGAVLKANTSEEANLRYLANLGFRLSMDQVSKLDFDWARARRLGFHFLKVRAETLIAGVEQANASVAAEDFKDLLLRNGLNLVAERVEDEKTVVQLLEYNIDYAQGYLFGEPRPLRDVPEAGEARGHQPGKVTALPTDITRRLAG